MECYSIGAVIVCNCVCVVSVYGVLFYRCSDIMQVCVVVFVLFVWVVSVHQVLFSMGSAIL